MRKIEEGRKVQRGGRITSLRSEHSGIAYASQVCKQTITSSEFFLPKMATQENTITGASVRPLHN